MTTPLVFPGLLDPYFETGTEGVVWAVTLPGMLGYDQLLCLEGGDELLVYDELGSVAWQGIVSLEYERRYRPYPTNPEFGQQEAFGAWVHGFQEDVDPETWARWFFDRRPAVVRPKARAAFQQGPLEHFRGLMDLLPTDPKAALALAQAHDPKKNVSQALAWALKLRYRDMKWSGEPDLSTEDSVADHWQRNLALCLGARQAWAPGNQGWPSMSSRWATPESLSKADVSALLKSRFSQDP